MKHVIVIDVQWKMKDPIFFLISFFLHISSIFQSAHPTDLRQVQQ